MKKGIVIEKEFKQDYESGSGSLYIPILGSLFPRLFGQEMKPVDRWFVIVKVEDELFRYDVEKDLYNQIKIGDQIEIGIYKHGLPKIIVTNEK